MKALFRISFWYFEKRLRFSQLASKLTDSQQQTDDYPVEQNDDQRGNKSAKKVTYCVGVVSVGTGGLLVVFWPDNAYQEIVE